MNTSQYALAVSLLLLAYGSAFAAPATDTGTLARGRYLVSISGCNDCHTAGYPESGGKVPQNQWLTGSAVGWSGPWGTTYPANLRLVVQSLSESQWLSFARAPRRPPMPWFALRDMSDSDLRAIYQFLRHLGPKGKPAPAYVPPGQVVSTPYIDFVPKNLPKHTARLSK
jgi:mono/diheme cytochrome c family protein